MWSLSKTMQKKLNPGKRVVAAESYFISYILKSDYVTSTWYTKCLISTV